MKIECNVKVDLWIEPYLSNDNGLEIYKIDCPFCDYCICPPKPDDDVHMATIEWVKSKLRSNMLKHLFIKHKDIIKNIKEEE